MSYPYQQPYPNPFQGSGSSTQPGYGPPYFPPPPGPSPPISMVQPGAAPIYPQAQTDHIGVAPIPQVQTDHIVYLGTAIPVPHTHATPVDFRAIAAGAEVYNPETPRVPGYNPHRDVEEIRKACKGWGTNEELLISTLAPLNALQIDALADEYLRSTGRTLIAEIDKECSGWFRFVLQGIIDGPLEWDAHLVFKAIDGIGTNETMLNEILLGRSHADLQLLKAAFQTRYNRDLAEFVYKDLSGKIQRLFTMVLQGHRPPDTVPVIDIQVADDVEVLHKAGKRSDEITFCNVLINRSEPQLAAICNAYEQEYKTSLAKAIKSHFSGHIESALLRIVQSAGGAIQQAELLEKTMAGMGTNDEMLTVRIVRTHWDKLHMNAVKNAYLGLYGKTLERRIEHEVSGAYKKLLLALIGKTLW